MSRTTPKTDEQPDVAPQYVQVDVWAIEQASTIGTETILAFIALYPRDMDTVEALQTALAEFTQRPV